MNRRRGRSSRRLGLATVVVLSISTVVAISPAGAVSKPAAPKKPVAVPAKGAAKVTWAAPKNGGSKLTGYIVTPFLGTKPQPAHNYNAKAVTQVITGLTNGRKYTFKVTARNAVGKGAASPASNAVVIGSPLPPTQLMVAQGNGQARVNWVAPANNGGPITGYVITPFLGAVAQPSQTFNTAATADDVTGLTDGNTYTFRVAARNSRGTSALSAPSGGVTPTSMPALRVVTNLTYGPIIERADGFTAYLYLPDGTSTTSMVPPGPVKAAWPPITWSGALTVDGSLDSGKITAQIQPNGMRQLAYNGHLLYAFVADTSPGTVSGQGVAAFYVVSSAGNVIL